MSGQLGKISPVLQGAGTALSVMGNLNKAKAYSSMGTQQTQGAELEAQQFEANAKNAIGASQQGAYEQERQGTIAASRALAVAAASGGGASDPTIVNLMARMAGESHYNAMAALYQGQEQSRAMTNQASIARYGGEVAQNAADTAAGAAKFSALTTAITGAGSLYAKYGKGQPGKSSPKTETT